MIKNYEEKIKSARELLKDADYILIGAGAGLSTAGGFEYGGETFNKYFADFKDKYGLTDMYSGGFYPFKTEEEKWAFWSRMVYINRYKSKANDLYLSLKELVGNKNYFIITTNVDHQFQLAGFDKDRLFYTQGDYGLFQCSVPCHDKTYDNQDLVFNMLKSQGFLKEVNGELVLNDRKNRRTKIDKSLIPKCPVCSRNMEMNLRAGDRFVQDTGWYEHAKMYREFLEKSKDKKLVLIEIGVGYNTPAIIKYPFEQMTYLDKNTHLIRINKDYAFCPEEIRDKTLLFNEDTSKILTDLT